MSAKSSLDKDARLIVRTDHRGMVEAAERHVDAWPEANSALREIREIVRHYRDVDNDLGDIWDIIARVDTETP